MACHVLSDPEKRFTDADHYVNVAQARMEPLFNEAHAPKEPCFNEADAQTQDVQPNSKTERFLDFVRMLVAVMNSAPEIVQERALGVIEIASDYTRVEMEDHLQRLTEENMVMRSNGAGATKIYAVGQLGEYFDYSDPTEFQKHYDALERITCVDPVAATAMLRLAAKRLPPTRSASKRRAQLRKVEEQVASAWSLYEDAAGEAGAKDMQEDAQTQDGQPNSKKKRASDVAHQWKGRLCSAIQKKKRPVCGMYKGVR